MIQMKVKTIFVSCNAMKKVYRGSIDAFGYCGQGSTMVSAWIHWRGAPGSATRHDNSCIVPSLVTVRWSSGAKFSIASFAASATMPSMGSHWS